jgi:V/A-type H+-transporting ATPase subunit A
VVQVFWSLEDQLAGARHFPAISWLRSYSLYQSAVDEWADENVNETWSKHRSRAMSILQRESELEELVQLVGVESLGTGDRLLLEVARMIREDFLQQNAFDDVDTYCSLEKQDKLLGVILKYYELARQALDADQPLEDILEIPAVEGIARGKLIPQDEIDDFEALSSQIEEQLSGTVTTKRDAEAEGEESEEEPEEASAAQEETRG